MGLLDFHKEIEEKCTSLLDEMEASIFMGKKNKINEDIVKSSLDLINSVSEMLTHYTILNKKT